MRRCPTDWLYAVNGIAVAFRAAATGLIIQLVPATSQPRVLGIASNSGRIGAPWRRTGGHRWTRFNTVN